MKHQKIGVSGIACILVLFMAGPALAEEVPSPDVIKNALMPRIRTMGLDPSPRRAETRDFDMHIPFDLNQYLISPRAVPYVKSLGEALTDKDIKGYVFEIQGHTCNLGSDEHNIALSRKRAASVREYLISHFSLSPSQILTEGYGKTQPRADNSTEEGRQQNRRVTVVNTMRPFAGSEKRPFLNAQVKYIRGKETRELRPGETLTARDNYCVTFIPTMDCHVYVYQVGPDSKMQPIFPDPDLSTKTNPVRAGELHRVPARPDLWLHLDDSKGEEEIIVIASPDGLDKPDKVCQQVLGRATMLAQDTRSGKEGKIGTMGYQGSRPYDIRTIPESGSGNEPPRLDRVNSDDLFTWRIRFNHQ